MPGPGRIEIRPDAVLVVGVTGHREIGVEGAAAKVIAATLHDVLQDLSDIMSASAAANVAYFSDAAPRLRLVTMLADGADLLAARAAASIGGEIAAVLPYSFDEYVRDFTSSESLRMLSETWQVAATKLELPGTRQEGARAYERASDVMIANCDLVIAIWDGKPARGRAGTGDVVQNALAADLSLIVIDPAVPERAELIVPPDFESFEIPIASELPRAPLSPKLSALVTRRLTPPTGRGIRGALDDFLSEDPAAQTHRFEYPLLLKIFRTSPREPERPTEASCQLTDPGRERDKIEGVTAVVEGFADRYGRMFRSSVSTRYLLLVLVSLSVGVVSTLYPPAMGIAILCQIAFNGLVIYDMAQRRKQRWQQRWLDYRSVAERLRRYRFLHPLGLGAGALLPPDARVARSWTDWFVLRHVRATGGPNGRVCADFPAVANEIYSAWETPCALSLFCLSRSGLSSQLCLREVKTLKPVQTTTSPA